MVGKMAPLALHQPREARPITNPKHVIETGQACRIALPPTACQRLQKSRETWPSRLIGTGILYRFLERAWETVIHLEH